MKVEEIGTGDLVRTAAGHDLPVLWHGTRVLTAEDLSDAPHLRPIRIQAGRFGARRDLTVSPQHGIRINGPGGPGLIRARHLAEFAAGVRVAAGIKRVTYHHLLLPHHALIVAEGCISESFYPGPMAVAALKPADRLVLATVISSRTGEDASLTERYGPRCLPMLTRTGAREWARVSMRSGLRIAV